MIVLRKAWNWLADFMGFVKKSAMLSPAGEITILQHDGVTVPYHGTLPRRGTHGCACAALTEVCTGALGYAQPVEDLTCTRTVLASAGRDRQRNKSWLRPRRAPFFSHELPQVVAPRGP